MDSRDIPGSSKELVPGHPHKQPHQDTQQDTSTGQRLISSNEDESQPSTANVESPNLMTRNLELPPLSELHLSTEIEIPSTDRMSSNQGDSWTISKSQPRICTSLSESQIAKIIASDTLSDPLVVPFANRPRHRLICPIPEVPNLPSIMMQRLGIAVPAIPSISGTRNTTIKSSTNICQEELVERSAILPNIVAATTNFAQASFLRLKSLMSRATTEATSLKHDKRATAASHQTSSFLTAGPSSLGGPRLFSILSSSSVGTGAHSVINEQPKPEFATNSDQSLNQVTIGSQSSSSIVSLKEISDKNTGEVSKSGETIVSNPKSTVTKVISQSETLTLLPAASSISDSNFKSHAGKGNQIIKTIAAQSIPPEIPSPSHQKAKTSEHSTTDAEVKEASQGSSRPQAHQVLEYWAQRNAEMLSEVGGTMHDTAFPIKPRVIKREAGSSKISQKPLEISSKQNKKKLKGITRRPSKIPKSSSSSPVSPRPTARSLSPTQRDNPPAYDPTKYKPPKGPLYERIRTRHIRPKRVRKASKSNGSGYPTWQENDSCASSTSRNACRIINSLPKISLEEKIEAYLSCVERINQEREKENN